MACGDVSGLTGSSFTWANLIAIVSAAIALFVFFNGWRQYRASERWKRAEFVASQIKEFNADKMNKSILLMMDYHPADVELYPDNPDKNKRFVEVDLPTLVKAIRDEEGLTDDEFEIKIFFEHFLQSLQRLNYFITARAIHPKELQADFYYPVGLMSGYLRDQKLQNAGVDMKEFSEAVKQFVRRWEYGWVDQFMTRVRTGRR